MKTGLTVILLLLLNACEPSVKTVDCSQDLSLEKAYENDSVARVSGYSKKQSELIASSYVHEAICQQALPAEASFNPFKPYFLELSDLTNQYRFVRHTEGFLRAPGSQKLSFSNGTTLLFCFNARVINCDNALACECANDFNVEPKAKEP